MRPLSLLPLRNFLFTHKKIKDVIRLGIENDARLAAVSFVDEWAETVIAAHFGTRRFPLQVVAEFTMAEIDGRNGFFGMW